MEVKEYYESGELRYTGQKVEGKRQGEWSVYDKDGNVIEKLTYSNDSLNFRQTFIDGNLAIEEELTDSIKHGELRIYYENGNLKALTNYVYGKEQGLSKDYYPNGNINTIYINKGGKTVNFKQYYSNGSIFAEADTFGEGVVSFSDSLGNRTYDVMYNNGEIIDTVKSY
ncbi:toxin-antitoxin system YwqK family antitoxin [Marivirga tractuosa]|nr:hypothetical protein [Marivirga tractuosa]